MKVATSQYVKTWLANFGLFCGVVFTANAAQAQQTVGVVVSGIGGTEAYAEQFVQYGDAVATALRTVSENTDDIIYLSGADVSKESVLNTIKQLGQRSADSFHLVFIGHGTTDSETWRFNIPGPDITTEDLLEALLDVKSAQQLVMIATSASGAVLDVLSQPGRIVVTATKSGGEINLVRFPQFLAEAMESTKADTDRNEILTLDETFRYANEKTQQYYRDQNLLASEHARLSGDNPERMALARLGSLKLAGDDPAVAELLDDRLRLEDEFIALKAKKPEMSTALYYEELETLLVSIARLQRRIDEATGWGEQDGVTNE